MWHSAKNFELSALQKQWLLSTSSLTILLNELSDNNFSINVKSEGISSDTLHELIKDTPLSTLNEPFFIREVTLNGNGVPWVYARTAIPKTTLHSSNDALTKLGSSSLGNYLFTHPSFQRSSHEIAYLEKENKLYQKACQAVDNSTLPPLWARRSVFILDENPLLVSETFLPAFWKIAGI